MLKQEKADIEALIELIGQAHQEIDLLAHNQQWDEVISILEQCQQGAISIGEQIESSEGTGLTIVKHCEKYCEDIFELYQSIVNGEVYLFASNFDKICTTFMNVRENLDSDIEIHYEVVFLPYKASMWDSMESIWKVAIKDSNCRTYVIPIPYFDKNNDGTVSEMHYDTDKYPDYVSITRYDEYDFENRKPEMVFIHNAYDSCNHLTTIHPFFYSSNLKKYVRKLIYVPYAISSKEQVAEQFVFLPGILNADRVILQSEAICQGYIEYYERILTEKKLDDMASVLHKKFVAWGSPKFDKMFNENRNDYTYPDSWKKLEYNPEEKRRKVFLLNTSINAVLNNSGEYLCRLKVDLELFRNNSNVLLLWRPHPLLMTTYKTLHHELYNEYKKIVEDYCEDGWGIYDDSDDLYRAITFSDAYFGDWSSVATLYQSIGLPVVIRTHKNWEEVLESKERVPYIRLDRFEIVGKVLRFHNVQKHIVFNYNIDTAKVSIEGYGIDFKTVKSDREVLCLDGTGHNREYFRMETSKYTYYFPFVYDAESGNEVYRMSNDSKIVETIPELKVNPGIGITGWAAFGDVKQDERGNIYSYCNIRNVVVQIDGDTNEIIVKPFKLLLEDVFKYTHSYTYEGRFFCIKSIMEMFTVYEESVDEITIRECAARINQILVFILNRLDREGIPNINIHNQDGKNGERIWSNLLKELEDDNK